MFRDDRMRPKSVALKSTIPSFVSGMFMVTRRWENNDTQSINLNRSPAKILQPGVSSISPSPVSDHAMCNVCLERGSETAVTRLIY